MSARYNDRRDWRGPPPSSGGPYRGGPPPRYHNDHHPRPPPPSHHRGGGGFGGGPPRGGGGGPPQRRRLPPDAVVFNSYEEEREWVEERRRKRKDRPTKFDVLPPGGVLKPMVGGVVVNPLVAAAAAVETPQQTRHARRIYVGNLPPQITELQLHRAIGQAIQTALIQSPENAVYEEQDPILSVYIDHERNFGFVEFKSVAMCTACMELDGLIVAPGFPPVKVKRPNDYQPTAAGMMETTTSANNILDVSRLGIISSNVQDGPNKIFIGGLHYHLQDNQVLELLTAFGKVKAFHLVKETPESDHSKGYCFVEYVDPNITNIAVAGLNGMDIGGGKSLTARLAGGRTGTLLATNNNVTQPAAISPTAANNNIIAAPTAASPNEPPPNHSVVTGYDVETLVDAALGKAPMPVAPQYFDAFGQPLTRIVPVLPIPTAPQQLTTTNTILMNPVFPPPPPPPPMNNTVAPTMIPNPIGSNPPMGSNFNHTPSNDMMMNSTRIVVLNNLVTDEDLSTEEDHKALIQEVRDECAKFGQLLNIQIPRVADGAMVAHSAIRKVYLEYASLADAMQAERELRGRQFGEGIIQTEYFPENDFAAGRFY